MNSPEHSGRRSIVELVPETPEELSELAARGRRNGLGDKVARAIEVSLIRQRTGEADEQKRR